VFHLFIWLLNRLGVDMEIHMASALPVGDLSVRMRNDRHEPNGVEKQRPERIRVGPDHPSCSHNATGADPLLQNGRRRLTITRRGEVASSVPVFGVRPIR
jgi:hypothetical protein